MSLAGPRLDRPSAIGDEGRPRATSLAIATLAVVGLAVAAGFVVGEPTLVTGLATAAGLTVAGIALLDRAGLGELIAAHGLLALFGSAFALLVLVAPFFGRSGLVISGFTLALFGIGMAWADVDGGGLGRGFGGGALTYVSSLGVAVFGLVAFGIGMLAWAFLEAIIAASAPGASLAGFALVVIATGCLCRLSLRWLPLRALTPRDRRDRLEAALGAARRAIAFALLGAIALLAGIVLLRATGALAIAARLPGLGAAFEAASSPIVVWPLVTIGLVAFLAGGVAAVLRSSTRQYSADATRRFAAVAVGFLLIGVGFVALVTTGAFAFVLLLVGPLVLLFLLGVLRVGVGLTLVPDRAGGPAIAAAGLVVAAIGLGPSSPPMVFACLAGAGLVWDVSTYGLGLTAELGHVPDTRRLELVHGLVSLGVAASVVLVATGLEWLRSGAFAGIGGAGAVVAIGFGALVLLLPVRG